MLSKSELRRKFEITRELIGEARNTGLTDKEIMSILGLRPRDLGMQTRQVLRAIQQGDIKPDKHGAITPRQVAEWMGKTRGTAIYHLNILRDAGYLG